MIQKLQTNPYYPLEVFKKNVTTKHVNGLLQHTESKDMTDVNSLKYAGA